MKTLIFLILSGPCFSQCLDLDLVLVGDFSGSVSGYEGDVADAFAAFVTDLDLSPSTTQIGMMLFSSEPVVVAGLSSDKDALLATAALMRHAPASGGTDMLTALQGAATELLQAGRPGYRKIVVVVSDGAVDKPSETLLLAQQLRDHFGIRICGVLIKNHHPDSEFMNALSGGCYAESSYQNLSQQLKNLDICL